MYSQENCARSLVTVSEVTIPCPEATDWKVVFFDDFNGDTLDSEYWQTTFNSPAPCDRVSFPVQHNNEGQLVRLQDAPKIEQDNLVIEDGICKIYAIKEKAVYAGNKESTVSCDYPRDDICGNIGDPFHYDFDYTTSALIFKKGFQATEHLRIDAMLKIPSTIGLHPSFWSFTGREELDFFELFGNPKDGLDAGIIEWENGSEKSFCKHQKYDLPSDGKFHLYSAEITPYWMKIYVDNILKVTFAKYAGKRRPKKNLFDECGQTITGPVQELDVFPRADAYFRPYFTMNIYDWVHDDLLPSTFEIDFVRILQKDFCGAHTGSLIVTEDMNINQSSKQEYTSITITKGKHLNIFNSVISLAKDGKITLEKGASLKLGNATITSSCDHWQGVVTTEDNTVIFGNNVQIDNAKVGVSLSGSSKLISTNPANTIRGCDTGLLLQEESSLVDLGDNFHFEQNDTAVKYQGKSSWQSLSKYTYKNNRAEAVNMRNDVGD